MARKDDERESVLAAAANRGRTAAIEFLANALPGLPLERLAQSTDSGTLHVGIGDRDCLAPLLRSGLLDEVLSGTSFAARDVKLVRDQEFVDSMAVVGPGHLAAGRPMLNIGALATHLDDGYTAVFDGIEFRDEASMRLAEATERVFGCLVNINGYLSLRRQMSFGAHWDDQEVIIIQLVGRKDWTVEQPVALSMDKAIHDGSTSSAPVWHGLLEPGGTMYVPRGWGHRVHSLDELSFHYTVTIPRLNGVGIAQMLAERSSMLGPGSVIVDPEADIDVGWDLHQTFDRAGLGWAVAMSRSRIASRSTQRLSVLRSVSRGAVDDVWVRSPVSSGWVVAGHDGGSVVVVVNGHHLRIGGLALEVLFEHSDGLARPLPSEHHWINAVVALTQQGVLQLSMGDPGWGVPVAGPSA